MSRTSKAPRFAGYVAWRGVLPEHDLPQAAGEQLLERHRFFNPPGEHVLGFATPAAQGEVARGQRR